ncbi:unnamed protein product [Caenorhabditis nigoni]
MTDNQEKKFRICQVFNDLSCPRNDEKIDGDVVKRFRVYWKVQLQKFQSGNIYPHLFCESSETGNWSINTVCDVIVNGKLFQTGQTFEFNENHTSRSSGFILKSDFDSFRIDGSVTIEYNVKIRTMTGIVERQKSINFNDDVAKESSDIVLKVGNQKFYVSKLLLTFHSAYFKSLFSGNFSESQKSEIELKDIDPQDFQDFLEIIYGISAVDDETVSEILNLADFFDAKTAVKRCENFLINYSKKTPKEKFGMTMKYNLENLKSKCLSEIQNPNDIRKILPEVFNDHENCIFKDLLEKSLSFK